MNRIVGILGGMGPQATVDLMTKVIEGTPVTDESEHVHMLVDCNPTVPPRTAALLEGGVSPGPELARMARGLVAAGAELLAMPCNTAHAYLEQVTAAVGVPVLDMVGLAVEAARSAAVAASGAATGTPTRGTAAPLTGAPAPTAPTDAAAAAPRPAVGLLATPGTRRSRLYHDRLASLQIDVIDLDDGDQARLDALIHHAKTRIVGPEQRGALAALIARLAADGADVVIAGCTEVPLLLPEAPALPVVDPTLVLARAIVAHAKGVTPA